MNNTGIFDLTQILISTKFEKEIVFESSVLAWIRIEQKCWIRIRIRSTTLQHTLDASSLLVGREPEAVAAALPGSMITGRRAGLSASTSPPLKSTGTVSKTKHNEISSQFYR
jgi:hypothetical protein